MVMDIKGDLSGIAVEGEQNDKINERYSKTKLPYQPQSFPVELMTISAEKRFETKSYRYRNWLVSVLKILGLNSNAGKYYVYRFKYADDKHRHLIDLDD